MYSLISLADVNITLGTTLQIVPSGNLPLKNLKHGGKLVICNLQPTKHVSQLIQDIFHLLTFLLQDKKAFLNISSYIDNILEKVCKRLGVEIPEYSEDCDPTKNDKISEWTLPQEYVKELDKQFKEYQKTIAKSNKNTLINKKLIKKRKRSE